MHKQSKNWSEVQYPLKATNIAMEANKQDINLTCPKDRLLKT